LLLTVVADPALWSYGISARGAGFFIAQTLKKGEKILQYC
ncbi:unnamed protein product, partial [marine sediment metagenome]